MLNRIFRITGALIGLCLTLTVGQGVAATEADKRPTVDVTELTQEYKTLRAMLFELRDQILADPVFVSGDDSSAHYLKPEIRQELCSLWYQIVDYYLTFDQLALLADETAADKKQIFHLQRSIFLTQYRVALELIPQFEKDQAIATIINEGDPHSGLQPSLYNDFKYQYLNVLKAGRYAGLESVAAYYGPADDAQLAVWANEDSALILAAGKGPGPLMTLKNGLAILERAGQNSWFPLQKGVAEWMGQTKVWRKGEALISAEQINALQEQLEPGDILLERREWYMTNVGIPGFWTHAAIYIGTAEQRASFSARPEVAVWLGQQGAASIDQLIEKSYPQVYERLLLPYQDGNMPAVIEALSPGVSLTSFEHSAACDSLAVLRPLLAPADRAAAVVRAMKYQGRPYDYAFDFLSDDALVCTELVVKAYLSDRTKQGLQLPLTKLMGHLVTPANAFAEQFDTSFDTVQQQFELISFFDGDERRRQADDKGVESFRSTWRRPKWHILLPQAQTDLVQNGEIP